MVCHIRSGVAGISMWLTSGSANESMCHGSPHNMDQGQEIEQLSLAGPRSLISGKWSRIS